MSLSGSFARGVLSASAVALVALLLTFGTACSLIQSISPETHLSDQVHQLNDEARWARVDLAAMRCDPRYRPVFLASHRRWGSAVRVADADITNLAMGHDGEATSLVTYQWVDERSMELFATTVRQRWTGNGEVGFHLVGEDIVAGEARLYEEVEGGPRLLEDTVVASGDEGAPTSGDEGAAGEGPREVVTRSEGAPITSTPVSRRDSQGVALR
jgi:hypothetical protein